MDGSLAHLGDKDKAGNTNDVAYVKQAFEDGVVHCLVFTWAYLVAFDVKLYAAIGVLQLHEGSGTHYAAAHNTTCYADILELAIVLRIFLQYLCAVGVHFIKCGRIGINTQFFQLVKRISADLFLFTQFCHNIISF